LGEIETRLLTHQWVKQACVIDREEPSGDKFICAYIQMNGKSLPGISLEDELKKYLSFSLPGYMIPACFVIMEKMPLTRSGKIDRKRLPVPRMEEDGKNFIEPGNETEIKLAKIWSEVLGINKEKIGRDSDFFQLGGHSLKTTVLQARIRETFNIKMPLAEIFRTPLIRELARYIDGKKRKDRPMEIETGDEQMVLLQSGTTKRNLFFIHAGSGEVEGYIELVNHLPAGYFYWGIRAERMEHVVPRPLTIEEMARSYIEKIKILQPQGPYHIAGWSIGGTIAFEMVHQLEKMGDAVGFFALIDTSPSYYSPEGKIKTLMHFIGASNREMVRWEKWHPYCQQPVKFHKVSGDHFSIMERPHVVSLAKIFNTLL
jgi:thioesterase domain-containing protein/acyl carrier protein